MQVSNLPGADVVLAGFKFDPARSRRTIRARTATERSDKQSPGSRRRPLGRAHRSGTCSARRCPCGIQVRSGEIPPNNQGTSRRLSSCDSYDAGYRRGQRLVFARRNAAGTSTPRMGKAAAWFQPHCGIPGITKKLVLKSRRCSFSRTPRSENGVRTTTGLRFSTYCHLEGRHGWAWQFQPQCSRLPIQLRI
ncbi:hypothetical protein ABIF56_006804 [Bradyrhizobium elkanii]